ncbi:MAG: hypothetical protein QXD49_08550 [Archaeoglobaceae archaeon]
MHKIEPGYYAGEKNDFYYPVWIFHCELQLFLLLLLISFGAHLIRFGGFIKLMGKIIAVFAVLVLRVLVVLYLASQP